MKKVMVLTGALMLAACGHHNVNLDLSTGKVAGAGAGGIIGGIIGLGSLRTPGEVAAVVPDPVMVVSLWGVSGLFIL